MNYRGSTGYGKNLWKLDLNSGEKMQDDISDGVRYLISEGIVDKNRLVFMVPVMGDMQPWQV